MNHLYWQQHCYPVSAQAKKLKLILASKYKLLNYQIKTLRAR
jgi:hypothetical protein